MSTSQGCAGNSAAREYLEGIAAGLMGVRPAASSATKSPQSPRTVPSAPPPSSPKVSSAANTPALASNPANSAPAAKENQPLTPRFTFSATSTATTSHGFLAPTPSFAMADPDAGPSLKGTPEQIAAAREFSQSATKGGHKDRRPRERLLSREASSGSRISRSSLVGGGGFGGSAPSSRALVNQPPLRSTVGPALPSPSNSTSSTFTTRRSEISAPSATGSAALHGRPAVVASNSKWGDFAANPSKKEDDAVEYTVKPLAEGQRNRTGAPTPPSKPQGTANPAAASQMANITNILHDRANDAPSPPHLRTKAPTNGANGASTTSTATETSKPAVRRIKTTTPALSATIAERAPPTAENKPAPVQQVEKKQKEETVVVETNGSSHSLTNGNTDAVKTMDDRSTTNEANTTFITVDQVKNLIAGVNTRVKELEEQNLLLQKQIEDVVQHEEGRKFLGTDNAKVPFFINVMTHRHQIISAIQVHSALTIGDLIRRTRIKANLTAAATKNPYISLNGTKIGHLTTLGEIGVAKDKEYKNLVFGFDGAEV